MPARLPALAHVPSQLHRGSGRSRGSRPSAAPPLPGRPAGVTAAAAATATNPPPDRLPASPLSLPSGPGVQLAGVCHGSAPGQGRFRAGVSRHTQPEVSQRQGPETCGGEHSVRQCSAAVVPDCLERAAALLRWRGCIGYLIWWWECSQDGRPLCAVASRPKLYGQCADRANAAVQDAKDLLPYLPPAAPLPA